MNKIVISFLLLFLTSPLLAEDINKTVDAAADGHVYVSNIAGTVKVSGWSRDAVEVTGTLGRNVEELIVERDGDKVKIKVKVPRNGGRGIASDLHIRVPVNSSLDIGTVSADIGVTEVRGEQELASVSGDVVTRFSGAELSIESVSGDIDVTGEKAAGEVEATSVSGDITLYGVSGDVSVESVSGELTIDEGLFANAEFSTVSGDIQFLGVANENAELSFESVNGEIGIELMGTVSVRFEIDTFNGRINNCFGPKPERTSKYAPGWELEFTVGDGDAEIEVSTLNGGVKLCKK